MSTHFASFKLGISLFGHLVKPPRRKQKRVVQSDAIGFPWHKILRDRCQGMCVAALDPNLVLDLALSNASCLVVASVHDSYCVLFASESLLPRE